MKPIDEMDAQELASASVQALWDTDLASQHLGMQIEHIAPGQARVSMMVTEKMVNGLGTCHGGYIFTLADSSFAFACNSANQRTVGQHATITYIAPAVLGDRLIAQARAVSQQGRSGLYDVAIVNQNGAQIAEFRGLSRSIKGALIAPEH